MEYERFFAARRVKLLAQLIVGLGRTVPGPDPVPRSHRVPS